MAMGLLRVKGQHYDVGGESTLAELLRMDGLFVLKDVMARLPLPKRRLMKMVNDKGKFSTCFCVMFKDRRNRGVQHIDLRQLNELLRVQAQESVNWRANGGNSQPSACLTCKYVGGPNGPG
jgi:hypothetical protein